LPSPKFGPLVPVSNQKMEKVTDPPFYASAKKKDSFLLLLVFLISLVIVIPPCPCFSHSSHMMAGLHEVELKSIFAPHLFLSKPFIHPSSC
jgi:hypothetical protein